MADNPNCNCGESKMNADIIGEMKRFMNKDSNIERLSEIFKVLGDPTRIRIIYLLSKCEMCVCDIASALDISQSAISHQLRLL
jgi:DNA-binding transcriptional ArsR family regulator